ncbi:lysophospholipase [Abortiporus biennis]|nr:lysophospholipase [Abortiporus biennis]
MASTSSETTSPAFVEKWHTGPDEINFYTRTYSTAGSPKAVVLFLHGFQEHVARYESIHIKYPLRGITLFSFDQRGFGRTALDQHNKSSGSSYGKTSWQWQLGDIEYFVKHLKEEYPGVPLFLMGHSMGGGLVLAFATRTTPPPSPETVKSLSGIIASSPFILHSNPPNKLLRFVGEKLCHVAPYASFPADVPADDLSRDPKAREAARNDPLIKRYGSLRILSDMFNGGEGLVATSHRYWPKDLPVSFIHGTADRVTSPKATEDFYNKIPAQDKTISLIEGGYHELSNEIDDIPERLFEECASFVERVIASSKNANGNAEAKL